MDEVESEFGARGFWATARTGLIPMRSPLILSLVGWLQWYRHMSHESLENFRSLSLKILSVNSVPTT